MTCAGSLEKRTSWAVPVFFGVTQRVPIAVVVALTGEHFGFVMLAFLVSAFAVERTREAAFAGDTSFATEATSFAGDASFAIGEASFAGDASFATGETSVAGHASFATGEASFPGGASFATGGCRCTSTLTVRAITGGGCDALFLALRC